MCPTGISHYYPLYLMRKFAYGAISFPSPRGQIGTDVFRFWIFLSHHASSCTIFYRSCTALLVIWKSGILYCLFLYSCTVNLSVACQQVKATIGLCWLPLRSVWSDELWWEHVFTYKIGMSMSASKRQHWCVAGCDMKFSCVWTKRNPRVDCTGYVLLHFACVV